MPSMLSCPSKKAGATPPPVDSLWPAASGRNSATHAAASVGGVGGGHNIASGATVPLGKDIDFIQALDEIVSKQMKRTIAK